MPDCIFVPINFSLVQAIYGEDFASNLSKLGVAEFFHINEFHRLHKRYPCVTSIWHCGRGSSFSENVVTQNGTLSLINDKPVPFGSEYYQAHFGYPLLSQ